MTEPAVISLATAVPEHVLDQGDVLDLARGVFGRRMGDFERLAPIFSNTGIRKRHSVCPLEWFETGHDWPQRAEAFLAGADRLYRDAAGAALDQAGLCPRDVDTIVTVCSTGIATPTLEARVFTDMGFRPDVKRVPVFGLGCAGGVSGLSLAHRLARADENEIVLLVVIELCTIAFRSDEMSKANIVATALFGDGAAAAVIAPRGDVLFAPERAGEHTWSDSLDIMGWRIDEIGFGAIFSKSIPDHIVNKVPAARDAFLERAGLSRTNLAGFVFHPGGARVIDGLEQAFALKPGHLGHERWVLSEFGNMSAPSVLFVLRRALDHGLEGRQVLMALGPGFSASFLSGTIGHG